MVLPHNYPCGEDEMIDIQPIETAPALALVPEDLDALLDELHAILRCYRRCDMKLFYRSSATRASENKAAC